MNRLIFTAALVALGCGGSKGAASPAGQPAPEAKPANQACVPGASLAQTTRVKSWSQPNGTVLCATTSNANQTCWRLDRAGKLHAQGAPPTSTDGRSTGGDTSPLQVNSTDGKHTAILQGEVINIVDRSTKKIVRPIKLTNDKGNPPKGGVDSQVTAMYFVGDTLLLRDSHAGPHEDVVAYTIDGKLRGTIWKEIYDGSITLMSEHHVGLGTADMSNFAVYDTRSHTLTEFGRKTPATPACTKEQREELNVDVEHAGSCTHTPKFPACCKQLESVYRWQSASMVLFDDNAVGLIAGDKHFVNIPVYKPGNSYPIRTLNLACATNQ